MPPLPEAPQPGWATQPYPAPLSRVRAYLVTLLDSVRPIVRWTLAGTLICLILRHANPVTFPATLCCRHRNAHRLQTIVDVRCRGRPGMQGIDKRLQLGPVGVVKSLQELIVPCRYLSPFVVQHGGILFVYLGDDFPFA